MKSIPIRTLDSREEAVVAEGFSIRTLESILNGKDLMQERHRHDFFFIIVVERGRGDHEVDFMSYKVKDHSIFFLRPGQVHRLNLKASSTGYVIEFSRDYVYSHDKESNQLLRKASGKNFCQFGSSGFKKINSVLNSLFEEYETRQGGYREALRANMKLFFIQLIRQRKTMSSSSNKEKGYQQERLEEFLELVETQLTTNKQVRHYADAMNLSQYQLNAITKESLGKTSSEIIDEYVVLEAKRYLIATSNQVSQIAYQLGYDDASYFIRFFKKHTGHSPEAFRNNSK
jgi:AraC-like DNA-binding protein